MKLGNNAAPRSDSHTTPATLERFREAFSTAVSEAIYQTLKGTPANGGGATLDRDGRDAIPAILAAGAGTCLIGGDSQGAEYTLPIGATTDDSELLAIAGVLDRFAQRRPSRANRHVYTGLWIVYDNASRLLTIYVDAASVHTREDARSVASARSQLSFYDAGTGEVVYI